MGFDHCDWYFCRAGNLVDANAIRHEKFDGTRHSTSGCDYPMYIRGANPIL